ncbi:MAG TPA: hypothetical protein VGE40_04125 [Bacilli bacterium]
MSTIRINEGTRRELDRFKAYMQKQEYTIRTVTGYRTYLSRFLRQQAGLLETGRLKGAAEVFLETERVSHPQRFVNGLMAEDIRSYLMEQLATLMDSSKGRMITSIRNFFRCQAFYGQPVHPSIFRLPLSPAVWKKSAFPTTIDVDKFNTLHQIPNENTHTGKRNCWRHLGREVNAMLANNRITRQIEEYVAYKRSLGYVIKIEAQELRRFAKYTREIGYDGSVTEEIAMRWASLKDGFTRIYIWRAALKHSTLSPYTFLLLMNKLRSREQRGLWQSAYAHNNI